MERVLLQPANSLLQSQPKSEDLNKVSLLLQDLATTIENEPFEDSEKDGNKTNIFVTASGETIQCGIYKDPLSFIFGGEDADPGEFPFVASIGNKRRRVTIKSYLLKLWLIFKF